MPHVFKGLSQFRADRPWGAVDLGLVEGASVRLHWSDQPYIWHVNDGAEVFVVITGEVEMRYREDGAEKSVRLVAGDAFFADHGDSHVAHPVGEARILVVEKQGSI